MAEVIVALAASDGTRAEATGQLTLLDQASRVRRVAVVLLVTVVLSAMLIPIPIIHLVGIPLAVIIGVAVAIRQGRSVARLEPMRLACPRCGQPNSLGGGLGYPTATGPISRPCEHCRRPLEMTFTQQG